VKCAYVAVEGTTKRGSGNLAEDGSSSKIISWVRRITRNDTATQRGCRCNKLTGRESATNVKGQ
jgi:hypothetical protein